MTSPGPDQRQNWVVWTKLLIDRIPLPFPVTVCAATAILVAEQALENSYVNLGSAGMLSGVGLSARLAIPLVFIYAVSMVKLLRGAALHDLVDLRPALRLSDSEYDSYVHRMIHTSARAECAMCLVSAAVVIVLWLIFNQPLPIGATVYLPSAPLPAIFIMASYVLFGWGGLALIVATVQFGVSLGALARCPLNINIFDAENLLPFGRLSLLHSLSEAGMILILLISLGPPVSTLAWSVVILGTVTSLMALVLPLWGVNRQMSQAKAQALAQIHQQFMECQNLLFRSAEGDDDRLNTLSQRIETLGRLRKTVLGAANWPFRDVGAGARAVITAMSPLVYVIATQALQAYLKTFIH